MLSHLLDLAFLRGLGTAIAVLVIAAIVAAAVFSFGPDTEQ